KFVKHYEPLNYRTTDLARVSRSAQAEDNIQFDFHAYGRQFKLHLRRIPVHESAFLSDATVEFDDETTKVERAADVYKGI
ncbi:hypothetical protein PFISCL1PPCAC_22115, partial [Pristionchus fissidentatus]